MSNYVQTTFFTPKDSLPPTNPAKTIFGAAYDVEFGNIQTAIATKADATNAVITIAGTTAQIAASAAVGNVVLSFPALAFIAPAAVIVKASSQSITSNQTLANDNTLFYAITVPGTYEIEILAPVTAGGGGISANVNYSGTITNSSLMLNIAITGTFSAVIGTQIQASPAVSQANQSGIPIEYIYAKAFLVAGTTGTVGFSWAQNSSSGAASTVLAGSTMTVRRLA